MPPYPLRQQSEGWLTDDIFKFWEDLPGDARTHPSDQPIFKRLGWLDEGPVTGFNLRCLPAAFYGPLRVARVVLLYLSPGFKEADVQNADRPKVQEWYRERRQGNAPLEDGTTSGIHIGSQWWISRTVRFGSPVELKNNLAIFNIAPYHAKSFTDYSLLHVLPSCRVSLSWAQNVLFPQAEDGQRVVVCLRASRHWGLMNGRRHGKALFAPKTNRAGYMLADGSGEASPDVVVRAVKEAIALGPLTS